MNQFDLIGAADPRPTARPLKIYRHANRVAGCGLLLILLALALAFLGSCRAHGPTAAPTAAPAAAVPVGGLIARDSAGRRVDAAQSAALKTQHDERKAKETAPAGTVRGLFSFLGRKNDERTTKEIPRKCKGCSFYYGPATVTTAGKKAALGAGATAGDTKAKAGAVLAREGADVAAVTGAGNLAAAQGAGASTAATQTKQDTTAEAPDWRAALAGKLSGPLGWALAVVALGAVGYGVWRLWPVLGRRKANDTVNS